MFCSLGEYQMAKECYGKALAIAIEIGDRQEEGKRNGNLGQVFCSLGEYQMAKECYGKALAIAIEIGDTKEEGIINANSELCLFRCRKSEGYGMLRESTCHRDRSW